MKETGAADLVYGIDPQNAQEIYQLVLRADNPLREDLGVLSGTWARSTSSHAISNPRRDIQQNVSRTLSTP